MVHSMTAFARVEQAGTHGTLSWELRQGLSRGKVECTLRFAEETAGKSLQVDQERARQLVAAAEGV
ncbi:hypothetical protein IGA69_29460, partial [Pseudomonas aeruginosa]|nr:hypothetical protein [Pseudomonas aeruginosa]